MGIVNGELLKTRLVLAGLQKHPDVRPSQSHTIKKSPQTVLFLHNIVFASEQFSRLRANLSLCFALTFVATVSPGIASELRDGLIRPIPCED
jgi:hypothetical protein